MRPSAPVFTMTSANCSGSSSRPSVFTDSWKALPVGHRRLADDAGGDLEVLLAQRGHDVARGEVEVRQAFGIEPDAHAVLAQPEQR